MLIVSFYTPEYTDHARRLIASLDQFALPHVVRPVESLGDWQRMTQFKAEFVRDMRLQRRGPIAWLDADAVVQKYPHAFDVLQGTADIAVHYRQPKNELLSGTLWLDDTEDARQLVGEWVGVCRTMPKTLDQRCLDIAMRNHKGLRVHRLPAEYCLIFDTMRRDNPGIEPVIEHFQASRQLRRIA